MKDHEIRKILISMIKAENDNVRIYQEKSIGSSICDVMAVTEQLIGYEIKSDQDNYQRLEQQVKAYDSFFDKNYIVIGKSRKNSIKRHIPDEWGIICVTEDDICIERKASVNKRVKRYRQLSILWKLELKNILMKNNLPAYAQKNKSYIVDKIVKSVDSDMLGQQIAEELRMRDYSIYNAPDRTISSSQNDTDQFGLNELLDTISEKDFEEFTLDKWISLYQKAKEIKEKKVKAEKEIFVDRIPHIIKYTDIEPSLGVPWISKEIIDDFIKYILSDDITRSFFYCCDYEAVTGNWKVKNKSYSRSVNSIMKYGIPRYNALYILEATLNLREIKLYKDGGRVYDEENTIAALEKQQYIIKTFKEWVWQDQDRIWEIEEAYNKIFAGFKKREYDGSKLTFPKMNPDFCLYPYQKDAVQKIISEKNTLLAFDVGSGKTYIMIAAAMKMREMGISRKNMFVVPNNIVGQWEKIFTDLYPEAKVLTIDPKNFKPNQREKVLRQMRDGDYDGIIIAYSCFEMIPLSEKYIKDDMDKKIKEMSDALKNSYSLEREKNHIRRLAQELLNNVDNNYTCGITFDSLEINTIFVDEAHNFKNIPIRTKLKSLNGINTKGSVKCLEMMNKIRCVQNSNDGRGVFLATGTPLCNSISDVYAMQMYLQYDILQKNHLDKFDNWVKTFAQPEQLCEIDVDTSKFRFITRFARFFNLPELSLMFTQCAIFHAVDQKAELPQFDSYNDVIINLNNPLSAYMNKLCERTEKIRAKEVDKSRDNMLKVSIDGRKAALDLSLVCEHQEYDDTSKVYKCVENVMKIYCEYSDCSQLIFCDYSTPKGDDFSVYSKLKELLISNGVPQNEIAFIHSYNTEQRRLALYEKVNNGKVRVVIGSTFKLGIGANVQKKLKAIHHLDVPWRPADMVQREGRILRRGNENERIFIYRYIAEGSFDAYSWQILETKQKFISQFLNGTSYQRTASDLENNVLTYAEVKALALSNPLMKLLAEKENELRNLRILETQHTQAKKELQKELDKAKMNITDLDSVLDTQKYLEQKSEKEYAKLYQKYKDTFTEDKFKNTTDHLLKVDIFDFEIRNSSNLEKSKYAICLIRNDVSFYIEMGSSANGNMRRIINFLKGFAKTADKIQERNKELQKQINDITNELKVKSPYTNSITECESKLKELRKEIYDSMGKGCDSFL